MANACHNGNRDGTASAIAATVTAIIAATMQKHSLWLHVTDYSG